MSQTDPIADMLTRIRNAMRARHNDLSLPHSNLREAVCRVLLAEGFLGGIEVGGEAPKKLLLLKLRYSPQREPVIRGVERVSRPSRRQYSGAAEAGRSRGAMGVQILSTPLGVMTGREARRKKVGGEILCRVW
ncbi:MAG TPA: 30S ribosomal protein S8 [Candidatus Binataceae bacterium]|nr:30S ribosomal protein S8 [Candidatus Binataceae bacterium]